MPRIPQFSEPADSHREEVSRHHFEEYEAGLDKTGPQFEEDSPTPDQEAAVHAAGVTAYYDEAGS